MADQAQADQKVIESINVRRTPKFNQAGGGKQFIYTVAIVTMLGNSGTFEVSASTYEDDEQYTAWLQESAFQLDKSHHMAL